MRIAITGGNSQLAREFANLSKSLYKIDIFLRTQLDICNYSQIEEVLSRQPYDVLLNCAAYNDVDGAESNLNENFAVNATGPMLLSKACKKLNINMIHLSTDYAFSSDYPVYFDIDDRPCPSNLYGRAKVEGEQAVIETCKNQSLVVRTSWLYGMYGGKFVHKIVSEANDRKSIKVVDDQYGQPTCTYKLAKYLIVRINKNEFDGIRHFTGIGICSRYELACEIYKLMGVQPGLITPVSTKEFPTKAKRPSYSLLKNESDWIESDEDDWKNDLQTVVEKLNSK